MTKAVVTMNSTQLHNSANNARVCRPGAISHSRVSLDGMIHSYISLFGIHAIHKAAMPKKPKISNIAASRSR